MILPILILVARSVTSNWWHAATDLALTPITLLPAHCRVGALFGRAGALPSLHNSDRLAVVSGGTRSIYTQRIDKHALVPSAESGTLEG
jgi:hypothetical protein